MTSAWRRAEMASQAPVWAGVGSANEAVNHSRVAGEKWSSDVIRPFSPRGPRRTACYGVKTGPRVPATTGETSTRPRSRSPADAGDEHLPDKSRRDDADAAGRREVRR